MVPQPTRLLDLPLTEEANPALTPASGPAAPTYAVVTAEDSPAPAADGNWEPLHPMHQRLKAQFDPAADPQTATIPDPHVEPFPGSVRVGIVISAAAGSWALTLVLAKRLLALF